MGCIALIVILAIGIGLSMVFAALLVACSGAMFLSIPWDFAWSAAWDQPGYLALFAFVVIPIFRLLTLQWGPRRS
jgi:hypothetical protein